MRRFWYKNNSADIYRIYRHHSEEGSKMEEPLKGLGGVAAVRRGRSCGSA